MLAFIPGIAVDSAGRESGFIQIISDQSSYQVNFLKKDIHFSKKHMGIRMGKNYFCQKGAVLSIHCPAVHCTGHLSYGNFTPLHYDIMGPLRLLPFLECNHGIISLHHQVKGTIQLNNEEYHFSHANGYIEKDWGHSFPRSYFWIQGRVSSEKNSSIVASAAEIPFGRFSVMGCFGIVLLEGREYRLASYLGAKVMRLTPNELILSQGDFLLSVTVLERNETPLLAPVCGSMNRTILENPICKSRVIFQHKGKLLLQKICDSSSFEYAGGDERQSFPKN